MVVEVLHQIFGFLIFDDRCHGNQSAEIGSLLVQHHFVTALRSHARCFHPRRAAADHQYLLLFLRWSKGVFRIDFPPQGRIDPAFERQVLVAAIEAVQAAMAPADIVQLSGGHLIGQIRIGQQSARHAHKIQTSLAQILLAHPWIYTARCPYGNILNLLFDGFTERHRGASPAPAPIHTLRQVVGRLRIQQLVGLNQTAAMTVAVSAAVEAVGARVGHQFRHFHAFMYSGTHSGCDILRCPSARSQQIYPGCAL